MEKKDKLDEFMEENSELFDVYEPGPDLWEKIRIDVPTTVGAKVFPVKTRLLRYSTRAAAVAAIFGASYMFHRVVDGKGGETVSNVAQVDSLSQHKAYEFQEAQAYYVVQVSNRMKDLELYASEFPDVMQELKAEMIHLDDEFKKLQGDLGEGMARQEIVDAMIQNYRLKLEILERMKELLDKNGKNKAYENNEM